MNKSVIRRRRLRELIDTRYKSVQAAFAEHIERSPDYISRCLYQSGKKGAKNIGEKFARHIEEKESLPAGWLDDDGLAIAPAKTFKSAIKAEAALDPYAMIETALRALVIVGSVKLDILARVKSAAKDSELSREIFMQDFAGNAKNK